MYKYYLKKINRSVKLRSYVYLMRSIHFRVLSLLNFRLNTDTIYLASVCDEKYFVLLYALVNSVKHHTKSKVIFSVLDVGISTKNISRLQKLETSSFEIKIIYKQIDTIAGYEGFIKNLHPTYERIFLPYLLEPFTNKFIYLDCDMIVKYDINNLWNISLDECIIGAVKDNMYPTLAEGLQKYKDFNLNGSAAYFNASLLIIDINNWEKLDVSKKILDVISRHDLRYRDQDAINIVCYNKCKVIDTNWNLHPDFYPAMPFIVHYLQPVKPHCKDYQGRGKALFDTYAHA